MPQVSTGGSVSKKPPGSRKKAQRAVERAIVSPKTPPAAARKSRKAIRNYPRAAGSAALTEVGKKQGARQILRKQTRKALTSGMKPGSRKGGLSITKNEGRRELRDAIETLGYKGARKVVKKTTARQRTQPRRKYKAS